MKETLLVVDDDAMNRNVLSRRLERSGFEVEVAASGAEALTRIGNRPFDLILLDQMMPEKSGSEVLRELREQYSQSDLPVIMVTAMTESGRVAEALNSGANDYITKPVDFTVALARIRAQLARKHAETGRRVSEERYELAARASNDGLWDWDLVSNHVYYSARWKQAMGLAEDEIGNSPEEWFSRVHAEDLVLLRKALQRHLDLRSETFEADYRIRRRDGLYRWMTARGIALRNSEGVPVRIAGSQSDITEKKTADALTSLPNRTLFEERLRGALDRFHQDPAARFAVCFIDVDRFKLVNDTLGHAAGDQFLIEFSQRLSASVEGRSAVVARMGGDEFAVLLEGIEDAASAIALGERMIRGMRPAFLIAGQELYSTASVGIVLSLPEHSAPEELILDADIAMYTAKGRGRGRCAVFDSSMRRSAFDRLELESDLRMALGKGQFVVYYQSRVDLESGQIRGFEALLRWQHPQRGMVQPDQFIRVAEDTGMIREIGLWVFSEACDRMRRWRDEFPERPWLDVAVNVSPIQLRDPGLVSQIAEILAESGLEPSALQIEITESSLVDNLDEARKVLLELKSLGVGLKLDDFATGYSCLRYLYRLPFDSIKIDRSFTMDLNESNPESKELVRTILTMAQNMGLGVIAEGVENQAAAHFLRDEGCKFGQGYHFSPPLPAEQVGEILRKG